MDHPRSRSERRAVRELYIKKRKFQIQNARDWYLRRSDDEPPHEGEGYYYDAYIEYLNWQNLSDDERKIIEVEAVLDGKIFKPPTWNHPVWGRYAKLNLSCGCYNCQEKTFERAKLKNQLRRQELRDYRHYVNDND